MALVLNTNCGLVTESPTTKPTESSIAESLNTRQLFLKIVPSSNVTVTELGFYDSDWGLITDFYNMGIFSGDLEPTTLIYQATGQALIGSNPEIDWYKYTGLNISLTANIIYWIGLGVNPYSDFTIYGETVDGSIAMKKVLVSQSADLEAGGTYEACSPNTILPFYAKYEISAPSGSVGFSGLLNSKLLSGGLIK